MCSSDLHDNGSLLFAGLKIQDRAAVKGVDYPVALCVIVPYPALCVGGTRIKEN